MLRNLANAIFALIVANAPASASEWIVEQDKVTLAFTTTHAGRPVKGVFAKLTVAISFDPASPAEATVNATIDLDSGRTGEVMFDRTLGTADWLNIAAAPTARFEAKGFTPVTGNSFTTMGNLTLKGITASVPLAFNLKIEGDRAEMSGKASLDRIAFRIGTESDPKAEWVGKTIDIDVRLEARRKP